MTIKWSFSSLKTFLNCPRQYAETRVFKNFTIDDTEQSLYGKAVHLALEQYGRDGVPLAKNYERFKSVVDVLLAIPGQKYFEHQMAITVDATPCDFEAEDYWVRGIADVLIVDRESGTATVVDYKTGSARYPDTSQLKLMALLTFYHFPEVKHVRGGLAFLLHNVFRPEEYTRDQIEELWSTFNVPLQRLILSFQDGWWPTNPSGLCGWCPVTTCEHYTVRRRT
jgi:hypothetical protein